MKIVLTGAQGTGKSTLVRELTKHYPDLVVIDSVASEFLNSKDELKCISKTREFQAKLSLNYFDKLVNNDNYISSRWISDIFAYSQYDYKEYGDPIFKTLGDVCSDVCNEFFTYRRAYIFYVPIRFDVEETNLRSGNKEFQYEIDMHIRDFLIQNKIDNKFPHLEYSSYAFHKIESLSVEDRIKEIIDFIAEEQRRFDL